MMSSTRILLCVLAACGLPPGSHAQNAEPLYIVTYLEVAPSSTNRAANLLRQHAEAARQAAGNRQFEALQRFGRGHHFALLEIWDSPEAQQAHARASATERFRDGLAPLLTSPYDEREHAAFAVGAASASGRGAIFAVTHVDIVPTFKDTGVALVRQLVESSRDDPGNLRFDALAQSSRTNHMTIVELWENRGAQEGHLQASHVKTFRDELLPLSGSLYDERLYRAIP